MSSRSDDRDEMARDLPGVCSSATNCLTHATDPDGTVWLSSTRRPDVRLRVDPDEWASRPATLGGPGELADAEAQRDQLRQHILDIDAHATPYGDIPDEPGWVGTYLVTAGALHRALGKIGHSAPKCEAEARLAAIEQHARDAGVRLLELQAERGELALALETVTAERDRRGDELRRARDVLVAAKVRAQVLRDLREFGSGAEGWPERDRISDKAVLVAVDALDHGEVAAMGDH